MFAHTTERLKLGVLAEPGLLPLPTCQSTEGSSLPSLCLTGIDCSLFPLQHQWSKKGTTCSEASPSPAHLHLPQLESNPNLSPWEIPRWVCKSELTPSQLLCDLLRTGREGHLWCVLGHPRPQPQGHSWGKAEPSQGCSTNTSSGPDPTAPSVAHINLGSLSQQENLFGGFYGCSFTCSSSGTGPGCALPRWIKFAPILFFPVY